MKKRLILLALGVGVLSGFAEDFESSTVGAFEKLPSDVGRWLASDGQAEINGDHARSGKRSLRIFGGAERSLELDLGGDRGGMLLSFWAERWTARGPFVFRIEAGENAGWREIFRGDGAIRVGGFLTEVAVMLPAGTRKLRFRASTPDKSGLMMDDLTVEKVRPMAVEKVTTLQPVMPVLLRKKDNPVIGLKVTTEGRGDAVTVKSLTFDFEGSTDPDLIGAARVFFGGGASASRPRSAFRGSPEVGARLDL